MAPAEAFLNEVVTPDGAISTDRLISALHVSKTEMAVAFGLSRDAVSKRARLSSRATQARLRDVVEIINRVLPWTGSVPQAFAWYRAQPLPSFGDRTAEDLVKEGRAEDVKAYLSRIAVGGYA
ncbi:antitoxin Xre/MbcA/ParS toxin-binding domain-containing protein [Caenispirillum salinarum]|uniref:antitoxin Xre/MbcA/ParS toxin-binding domain-containing protein n=1 Tax=Caenispirillum salinarum TaxID=859058 RepID=UPI0038501C81